MRGLSNTFNVLYASYHCESTKKEANSYCHFYEKFYLNFSLAYVQYYAMQKICTARQMNFQIYSTFKARLSTSFLRFVGSKYIGI